MPAFDSEDGLRLHYHDEGEGLPVLCLAGLTRNAADFDHVAPHLSGVRLIRPDYRGRGRSDHGDPASYTVAQEARDALRLLDHLGIARAAILGTSRGGLIAMVIATTAKERLTGVALNDIGPEIAPEGLKVIEGYLGRRPAQKTFDEAARFRAESWTGFEGVPHERWLAEVRGHYEETPEGLELRYDPRLREAVLGGAVQPAPDLWPLFDALAGLPLALIRGANSELLSPATAAEMRRRRPDMAFAEVPGRGHVPFLDEAEALGALNDWLARCRAREGETT
ncbi:alpha/beta fold hydrolase [Limimaricola pyoseonensis]|uniref:Pimeloyl-ACP methyl ester carboxylesterase n=1 Tax=Limimaricola pyoseonensis TaxID=521013 RepID=A0A1G7G739_9RHOB|nr:alpha/beta hydrolase [Limimaricola pyoseonensis]SDE83964.1 Pimeloyl-ACP methyl ester carboxylesterase [Limimaricola pyoseonensis]